MTERERLARLIGDARDQTIRARRGSTESPGSIGEQLRSFDWAAADAILADPTYARSNPSTARALEVILSRCKMDRQTADVLRQLLSFERDGRGDKP